MPIPAQTPRTTSNGNGSATIFNYNFKITDSSQLAALVVDADGTPHQNVVISNITGVGSNSGGTFTYNPGTPLPAGATITAYLNATLKQDEQITNQGNLYLNVIQKVLDTIVLQLQMVADKIDRAPKLMENTNLGSVTIDIQPGGMLYADPVDASKIKSTGDYASISGQLAQVVAIKDEIADVAAIHTSVSAVAANSTNINTAATNIAAIIAAPQAATNAANSATAAAASAASAYLIATTGDYFVLGPGTLTSNQATGVDPIVLPADPKIAARVNFVLGGVPQIPGTDFTLNPADTTQLIISGGSSSLAGVTYSGVVYMPSSLTNINAPSAGSVTETAIQNGAVNLATKVSGTLPEANLRWATTSERGIARIASSAEVNTRTDSTKIVTPDKLQLIIGGGTFVPTTSGTSLQLTNSIPSWAKRITIALKGVSLSGTSRVVIQAITSSGIVSAAYLSVGGYYGNTNSCGVTNPTNGFATGGEGLASETRYGILTLLNAGGNDWILAGSSVGPIQPVAATAGGFISLGAALTGIQIASQNGTDTLDAGGGIVYWE